MSEFLFLYRRPPHPDLSPEQLQTRMHRWQAWFDGLRAAGCLANVGHPLEESSGVVVRDSKRRMTDGPYAETKDLVFGYSVIEASSFEDAAALTAGWPGFDDGGMIEIRTVVKM